MSRKRTAYTASLETGSLGEVDAETIPAPLVSTGHFGGGMSEMLLHITLVDLGRRGETSAQRVTGKFQPALDLRKIAANAGDERRLLHQARHLLVVKPIRADILALAGHATEEGAFGELGELDPGFDCGDRAGGV